jgi:hypothetical protein
MCTGYRLWNAGANSLPRIDVLVRPSVELDKVDPKSEELNRMRNALFLLLVIIGFSLAAAAQGNDFALVAGAKFTPSANNASATTTVNTAAGIEASLAHQIKGFSLAGLSIELPVLAVPNSTVTSSSFLSPRSYSSIYITPGARLSFASTSPISPWVAAGGGVVRFNPSPFSQVGGNTPASGSLKGAVDVGGGIDIRVARLPFRVRIEAREYFNGAPNLNILNLSLHNNLFAGAGLVFRF